MLIAVKRRAVEYFIVFHRWLAIAIRVCNFPKCPVTTGKFNFSACAHKFCKVFCTFVLLEDC